MAQEPTFRSLPWLSSPDGSMLRGELLRRAADGFAEAEQWQAAGRCRAEQGELDQAAELYLRAGDHGHAAALLLSDKRYQEALAQYLAWQETLDETATLEQVQALLGQAACHLLGARLGDPNLSQAEGQGLVAQARTVLDNPGQVGGGPACWVALGRFGTTIGRLDLVQEGYERALDLLGEGGNDRQKIEIAETFQKAMADSRDQSLHRSLAQRIAQWTAEGEES